MQIKVVSYTGNGGTKSITGVGFKPDLWIVKSGSTQGPYIATSGMAAGYAKRLDTTSALVTGHLTSLDSDGFTLPASTATNANGVAYHALCIKISGSDSYVGSYVGTGAAHEETIGIAADFVLLIGDTAAAACMRMTGMTNSASFAQSSTAGAVTGLTATGFTVGTSSMANTNGATYHVIALKGVSGFLKAHSYAGTGVAQNITGVGFDPQGVIAFYPASKVWWRNSLHTGSTSRCLFATADGTTDITGLITDGFSVGTDGAVNTASATHFALAYRDGNSVSAAPRRALMGVGY